MNTCLPAWRRAAPTGPRKVCGKATRAASNSPTTDCQFEDLMTRAARPILREIISSGSCEPSTNTDGSQPIRRRAIIDAYSTIVPQPMIASRGALFATVCISTALLRQQGFRRQMCRDFKGLVAEGRCSDRRRQVYGWRQRMAMPLSCDASLRQVGFSMAERSIWRLSPE